MIIGQGLLARTMAAWQHRPDTLVFASGVSNSLETRPEAFAREATLLAQAQAQGPERTLIYFSTCSIGDATLAQRPYIQHKLRMEQQVAQHPRFLIVRLPQVVGHTPNPHTLTNFLAQAIRSGQAFEVQREAQRRLIDARDIALATALAVDGPQPRLNTVLNLAGPNDTSVLTLVHWLEELLQRRGQYQLVDGGGRMTLQLDHAWLAQIPHLQQAQYPHQVVQHYYAVLQYLRKPNHY